MVGVWFKNAVIWDSSVKESYNTDIFVKDGKFVEDLHDCSEVSEIDLRGGIVIPGLIDIHAHLRTPGQEHKEDIHSGTKAAVKGGITTLVAMPNTDPVMDTPETLELINRRLQKEAVAEVWQASSMTVGRQAKNVVNFAENAKAGARVFTDDGSGINDEALMLEICREAKSNNVLLMEHPESHLLSGGASCSYGKIADLLGIDGQSAESESLNILKFGTIAGMTGARIHFTHISTRASVEAIRMLKKLYPNLITADATPHHILLSEDDNTDLDTDKKMNPPLRPERDRKSIEQALIDGVIDCVATDHAPHSIEEKSRSFEKAPFGVIGFETLFAALYTHFVASGKVNFRRMLEWVTSNPARIIGHPAGSLKKGTPANFAVVDLDVKWKLERSDFVSKSSNSAFLGRIFQGRVKQTFVGGRQVYVEG